MQPLPGALDAPLKLASRIIDRSSDQLPSALWQLALDLLVVHALCNGQRGNVA
jgi:hypothetical protein